MPAPVLYPGQRSLRKDSMTWSVATAMWVAPRSSMPRSEASTPRTAPAGRPSRSVAGGAPKWWRKSS